MVAIWVSAALAQEVQTAGTLGEGASEWADIGQLPRSFLPRGIVNGTDTGDYPAVFSLTADDGAGGVSTFCSGTLVHAEWGITAAHCIEAAEDYEAFGIPLYAAFGSTVFAPDLLVELDDLIAIPTYDAAAFAHDIGVVKLASPVKDITPMLVNDEPIDDSWSGTQLTFVGYGITGDGKNDSGTKRTTDLTVTDFDDQYVYSFELDSNVCNGDSGGAALEHNGKNLELSGVNAFVTPSCNGGSNGATRVDMYLDSFVLLHVPRVYADPADLQDALNGEGLPWIDLGVGEQVQGLGGRFPPPSQLHEEGCSTAPPSSVGLGLFLGALALRRRR